MYRSSLVTQAVLFLCSDLFNKINHNLYILIAGGSPPIRSSSYYYYYVKLISVEHGWSENVCLRTERRDDIYFGRTILLRLQI
jgi:hypothetical protein